VTSEITFFVFDYFCGKLRVSHCLDHIVGQLGARADLVNEPIDLRGKTGVLLVWLPVPPTVVV
jgi:hypothetical protein